jgi:hypothetical protein
MTLGSMAGIRKVVAGCHATAIVIACLCVAGCDRPASSTSLDQRQNGKALARTISMLTDGEGANTQFRVLFYGQSITSRKWTNPAAKMIEREYPKVNFRFANLAIGGNAASLLKRAVARDIDEFYPDLVIFHDYGAEKDYEEIVKTIRTRSAAEVILQTDHLRAPPEPLCPVELNLTLKTPAGCTGSVWLRQHNWDDYMSGAVIPRIATRYGAAIDPRRTAWSRYLTTQGLAPSRLLQDEIHPNEQGWRLAAVLFNRFLVTTVRSTRPEKQNLVKITPAVKYTGGETPFDGNRLEIITSHPLHHGLASTVDGVPSDRLPGCWVATRVSSVPWIPEWPALRQVTISDQRLEADEWTVEINQINRDLTDFRFRLYSKAHGFDGEGNGRDDFISKSGAIRIDASDWVLNGAMKAKPVSPPEALTLRWSRRNICGYRPDDQARVSASEYHYIIATGIENASHTAVIKVAPEDFGSVKAFMSYKPWLS